MTTGVLNPGPPFALTTVKSNICKQGEMSLLHKENTSKEIHGSR
jgi:hypothetical protein